MYSVKYASLYIPCNTKNIFAEDVDMGGDGSDSMAIYGTNAVLKLKESFGHNFWSDGHVLKKIPF